MSVMGAAARWSAPIADFGPPSRGEGFNGELISPGITVD